MLNNILAIEITKLLICNKFDIEKCKVYFNIISYLKNKSLSYRRLFSDH